MNQEQKATITIRNDSAVGVIVNVDGGKGPSRLQPQEEHTFNPKAGTSIKVDVTADPRWEQQQRDQATESQRQASQGDAQGAKRSDGKPKTGMTLNEGLEAAERTAPATAQAGRPGVADADPIEPGATPGDVVSESADGTTRTRTTGRAPRS